MKRNLLLTILFSLLFTTTYSQLVDEVIVSDSFADRTKFIDNSMLLLWGGNAVPTTAFELTSATDGSAVSFDGLSVTAAASVYSTYNVIVNGDTSLLTSTCFDYEFAEKVLHYRDTLKIEFDILWDKYDDVPYGENGRIVVTLMDDYPSGGANFNDIYNMVDPSPFGVPKYNLRIRNPLPVAESDPDYIHKSPTLMLYGGGHDIEGEFEKNLEGTIWFPGFSSEAGGGSPGQPSASDYPVGAATKKSDKPWEWVASPTDWKHITWVVEPELLKLYHRKSSQSEAANSLISVMSIPSDSTDTQTMLDKINAVHGTSITSLPLDYNWFPTFSSMRIYFRAWNNNIAHIANLKVTKSYSTMSTESRIKKENTVLLFPNPVCEGGELTVALAENSKSINYSVTNQAGQILINGKERNADRFNISLEGLNQGIYLLVLSTDTYTTVEKIVVE